MERRFFFLWEQPPGFKSSRPDGRAEQEWLFKMRKLTGPPPAAFSTVDYLPGSFLAGPTKACLPSPLPATDSPDHWSVVLLWRFWNRSGQVNTQASLPFTEMAKKGPRDRSPSHHLQCVSLSMWNCSHEQSGATMRSGSVGLLDLILPNAATSLFCELIHLFGNIPRYTRIRQPFLQRRSKNFYLNTASKLMLERNWSPSFGIL